MKRAVPSAFTHTMRQATDLFCNLFYIFFFIHSFPSGFGLVFFPPTSDCESPSAFRSLRDGLAKAGIGRNIDKYLEKCKEYGIDTADLYYTEDQPGDAWYLIGDWKPVRKEN